MTTERGIKDNITTGEMELVEDIDTSRGQTYPIGYDTMTYEELKKEYTSMSNEEINEVIDTLKESVSEDVKHLRDIQDAPYPMNTLNKPELIEAEVLMSINPMTGENTIIGDAPNKGNTLSVTEIEDGVYEDTLDDTMITDETYGKLNEMGITDEDAATLTSVILRYKKGEKFSIYKELPESVKNMVKGMCGSGNINQLQSCAKMVIEQFISELKIEQEFVNFQDSIKKELDMPGVADMYDDYLKEAMETNLLKKADELEALHPDKAESLRQVSKAYTDSYTMSRLIAAIHDNDISSRRLDKEIKKYNRYCTEFNFKYRDTKFKINDITLVGTTLSRVLPEVSEESLLKFIVLFCRVVRNMNPNDPVEHSFMYYTIKNILSLDFISRESEFYTIMIDNITLVINMIESKEVL